ncbi:FimV/HubP family polar landmark protein [Coralloluteibacterium thermophilus]|uniref:FimV/HubP family polar landmark protein n=1 Tax=Coralloluteibacterium thermophilum TaxID=2707049 RepID=A0ABV9NHY2_9GAMM
MIRKQSTLALGLALALAASQAQALGLGQIQVKSGLDQPFLAEIPIVAAAPGEVESLRVRLASPDAFERVGLERPSRLAANLSFEVVDGDRGQPVIRVTTNGPVNEPFLSFLLEVDWGSGRMMREFTALLDPPYIAPAVLRPATQAPVAAAPSTQGTVARPAPSAPDAQPATAPPPRPAAPAPAPAADPGVIVGQFGPVAAGQTLSQIASDVRPPGVSLNQMMMALHNANPDAFIDGNIHLIKRGAVLRVPERQELDRLGRSEADALVRQHTETWQQRIAPVPQPAAPELVEVDEAETALASARADGARLEIVPASGDDSGSASGQTGATAGGTGSELRAELIRAREDLAAREAESAELRARVSDLESQRENQQRLLELQNSRLAALQERLRELDGETAGDMEAELAEAVAPTDEEAAASEAAAADVGGAGSAVAAAADAPAAPAEPVVAAPADAPVAQPAAAEPAPPPGAPRWPWFLAGLALLAGGAFFALRRRRAPEEALPRERSALAAQFDTAAEAAEAPAADDAERLGLEEAVAADPDDADAHLALLRHHYDNGDAEAFVQAAEAMHAALGTPAPHWQAVQAMGRALAPQHPLFGEAPPEPEADPAGAQPAAPVVPGALPTWVYAPAGSREPKAERLPDEAPPADPDDLDDGVVALDMDIDADADADLEAIPERPEPGATGGWSEDERFAEVEAFEPPLDERGPSPGDEGGAVDAEAAETKLELARAYLDIGDGEGARGMLEEVVTEGTEAQRAEARRLLGQIG